MKSVKKKWMKKGQDEMLAHVIDKFEQMYDEHYQQGAFIESNLIVDMVAYLQDDFEGLSDQGI